MENRMQPHRRPRLLGVFAHPDDETFCAGGTLAKYVVAGWEVMVISATRGEAGQIRSGHADMIREDTDGTQRRLAQLGPGEFFGELAIVHQQPRGACRRGRGCHLPCPCSGCPKRIRRPRYRCTAARGACE